MMRFRFCTVLLIVSALRANAQTETAARPCVPDTATVTRKPAIDPSALAGTFRLAQIWTDVASERLPDSVSYSWLQLAVVDSANRVAAARPTVGRVRRRNLQLTGSIRAGTGRDSAHAEVDDGVLYLGCRDCTDASPEVLRITAMTERGFFGTWRDYQTGIGRVIYTPIGQRSPAPAGYFCAWRQ